MRKITQVEVLTNKNLMAKTVAADFSKKLDELLTGYIATNESEDTNEIKKEVSAVLSKKMNELFMGPGSSFSDTIKKQGVGADAEKEKKEKEEEKKKKELAGKMDESDKAHVIGQYAKSIEAEIIKKGFKFEGKNVKSDDEYEKFAKTAIEIVKKDKKRAFGIMKFHENKISSIVVYGPPELSKVMQDYDKDMGDGIKGSSNFGEQDNDGYYQITVNGTGKD